MSTRTHMDTGTQHGGGCGGQHKSKEKDRRTGFKLVVTRIDLISGEEI